jgi:hypothetical protein
MRHLATLSLALVFTLGSAGVTVSQVNDNPRVRYCNAGLERSINVCNNMHDVNSTGWQKCIDYSVSMHRMCIMEAVAHMDTIEP